MSLKTLEPGDDGAGMAAVARRRFCARFNWTGPSPSFSCRMRLSSLRYSITFCCCRFIELARATSKMCLVSLTIHGILAVRPANAERQNMGISNGT